jgi:hypothetical protein
MARMDDGFSTRISFSAAPTSALKLYEKEVTPPSFDAGGEIDTTTMLNTKYRTKWPKSLITLGSQSFVAAYDPDVYAQLITMLGVNQLITITFPDASTLAFWGWLNKFEPNALVEGEQPTANCEIICSNQDNNKAEVPPVSV